MLFTSGVVGYGIVEHDMEASVGGGLCGLAAAAMFTLAKLRAWTVDTSAERRRLEEAERLAHIAETRFIAAQGAQMQEEGRRVRDLEAERAALHARHEAERAQLVQELEDERAQIKIDAYLVGLDHGRRGIVEPSSELPGRLVQFPTPAVRERTTAHPADAAPEAARDRGVARP